MDICSIFQGRVASVLVVVGNAVAEGDELIVIESMKMELPVEAPCAGKVESIMVSVGDAVADGTLLVVLT